MWRSDCDFCGETIEADTVGKAKESGKAHLEENHFDEFEALFRERYSGEDCRNGCGYSYPVGVEEVAGFECLDCGYDHFQEFANEYVFWHIEAE